MMTTIPPLPSLAPALSPRAHTDARTAAATSPAGDASAIKALPTIPDSTDASLSTGAQGQDGMKERVGSLIDTQVGSGSLTGDQATDLKSFFAPAAPDGGNAADPAGSPAVGRSSGPSPASASQKDGTTGTAAKGASIEDQLKALEKMLDTLRQGLSITNTTYGSSRGTTVAPTGLVYQTIA
jgi:hypothetical protein